MRGGASIILAIVCLTPAIARAQEPAALKTADEIQFAFLSARPGQTLIVADGEYQLGPATVSCQATANQPLIIRAQNRGKVRFRGTTSATFSRSSHVTLDGFIFESDDQAVVQILGSNNIRITRNVFRLKQPAGASRTSAAQNHRSHWVSIAGIADGNVNSHDNRIDHNLFEDKHTMGNFISVGGLREPSWQVSTDDRIDHNHFRFIGPRVPNGMEAIRAGYSFLSLSTGRTVIEQNLFEECDGDPEIISIKNCGSIVRGNTFVSCEGGVCLRHGNGSRVIGNFFFGNKKRGTLGVRPYGDDSKIINNYFEGLTGPALQLQNGTLDYGSGEDKDRELLKRHFRPRRLTVAFNTVVDCDEPAVIGAGPDLPIQDLTFTNNVLVGAKRQAIRIASQPQGMTVKDNLVSVRDGASVGVDLPADQVKVVDVTLKREDGILNVEGPALARSDKPSFRPMTAKDVGPEAPETD